MKASLALLALFGALLVSLSEATPQKEAFEYGVFQPPVADHGDRHKRLTCDLLSFETPWITVNHAACAAHCLALNRGYRGGYCDDKGICVCRK